MLIVAVFAMIAFPATAILPLTERQPFWMRVSENLPVLLRDLPVSSFAKDILSAYAVGQIELLMEQ